MRRPAHGLDFMAIEIAHERRVIGVGIFRPQAGFAICPAARRQRRVEKRINVAAARCAKGDMIAAARMWGCVITPLPNWGLDNPEQQTVAARTRPISDPDVAGEHPLITQRRKRHVVERTASLEIGTAKRNMVEHGHRLCHRHVDGFDLVAVGVEHEGAVIGVTVFRAKAGRSVVACTSLDGGGVKGIDLLVAVGPEGNVAAIVR